MKKTDVYVVVDTPKKAKKLKEVLDMFGEKYGGRTFELLENKDGDKVYFNMCSEWNTDTVSEIHLKRSKVSIKELRNILAREYLKEGDVVILKDQGNYLICEFERMATKAFDGQFVSRKFCNLDGSELELDGGIHEYFIRYATEEEKALLEPKKELEVGKWYLIDCEGYYSPTAKNAVVYDNGEDYSYGFDFEGKFINDFNLSNCRRYVIRELTPQEVEQALIEEAKRRGFKKGFIAEVKQPGGYNSFWNGKDPERYVFEENTLYYYSRLYPIFQNGQWATIIEQGNFTDSDIAIVERLHDTLLDNHGYSLQSELLTDARLLANKIKSNIRQ